MIIVCVSSRLAEWGVRGRGETEAPRQATNQRMPNITQFKSNYPKIDFGLYCLVIFSFRTRPLPSRNFRDLRLLLNYALSLRECILAQKPERMHSLRIG